MRLLPFLVLFCHAAAAQLDSYQVQLSTLPLERVFDGTVEAVHQSTVSAQTSARVQELLVDVGDTVPPGTVILRLVSTEQREALNQAEAALAEAHAMQDAETLNYQRSQELLDRQVISKSEFDRVTAAYNTARARVASAEAALQAARQRLSYTEIRAPYGGVVSARHVEVGEAVNPGTPLMSGFDPEVLRVVVDLPQAAAVSVRQHMQVRVLAGDGELTPERITLFPVADPSTSTVRARVDLPHQATGLYPGQFVKVAFTVGETGRLLVPASAIVHRSEVTGVYSMDDAGVRLRQVRLGNRFGDQVEVLAGLDAGERIATDPVAAGISLVHRAETGHE